MNNELILVTGNKHKFSEIKKIAKKYGIKLKQKNLNLIEPDFDSVEKIAEFKAKYAFNKIKKPLIVEDTGIFFNEFNNFPGPRPKWIFEQIGYNGIFRLLKGKNRNAFFKTIICFTDGKKIKKFSGKWNGAITKKVFNKEKNVLPYEKIFIPEKMNKTLSNISREEKNLKSHRGISAKKFFNWFSKHNKKQIKQKTKLKQNKN